jgi:hypothetical protein
MRASVVVRIVVVAGLAAILPAGCHFGGDMFHAKFTRNEDTTAPLAGITALDVSVNVGKIRLDAADVLEARIQAEIQVKAHTEEKAQELAERVRIVVEPSGQTLRVKAIKPAGLKDENLNVEFTITAPAALALKCTINVGDIRTAGFTSRIDAHTDVGTITCLGLQDDVDLHTNVGDVRAEYTADAPAAFTADVSTNVGSVELVGPREISANLTATANVGDIDSDRPLTVSGRLKQSIRASLGGGEGRIDLRTNVGSIRIR